MLRGRGLNFLNFDLQFIFDRISQVKHVHEDRKSICYYTKFEDLTFSGDCFSHIP